MKREKCKTLDLIWRLQQEPRQHFKDFKVVIFIKRTGTLLRWKKYIYIKLTVDSVNVTSNREKD